MLMSVVVLSTWGILSDKRAGLSFTAILTNLPHLPLLCSLQFDCTENTVSNDTFIVTGVSKPLPIDGSLV
jgi:hypothetical protein